MSVKKQSGFTIIEVILFLAIGGGLLAMLLVGVGTSISRERYKDSVSSLTSAFQQQYTLAANVTSERSDKWSCGTGKPALVTNSSAKVRGSTDCQIIGRLVMSRGGGMVTFSNIIAYNIKEAELQKRTSDIDALTQTAVMQLIALEDVSVTSLEKGTAAITLDWGSSLRILNGGGASGGRFVVAIVRGPISGQMMTFSVATSTVPNSNPGVAVPIQTNVITAGNLKNKLEVCVEPPAGLTMGMPKTVITVAAGATNATGITRVSGVPGC